jgi:hypothetical protein
LKSLKLTIFIMALSFRILLLLLISNSAWALGLKEIIRFDHEFAKKKCANKGRSISSDHFISVDCQKSSKTKYISRYHKDCEEASCQVKFNNETWSYKQNYIVCKMPMPEGYLQAREMRIKSHQQPKVNIVKEETIEPSPVDAYLDKLAGIEPQKPTKREPSSVKQYERQPQSYGKKLSCMEFVKDLNSWIVELKPRNGVPTAKNKKGLYPNVDKSLGTEEVILSYQEKYQRKGLKKVTNSLELVKVKLEVLGKSKNKEELYEENKLEYNRLIKKKYQYFLEIAQKLCFNEFIENRSVKSSRSAASN